MSESASITDHQAVIDCWPEPIAVLEPSLKSDGGSTSGPRVRWFNPSFEAWFGELPNLTIEPSLLRCVSPDHRVIAIAAFSPLEDSQGPASCRFEVATSATDADGFPLTTWLEANRRLLPDGATLLSLKDVGAEAALDQRISDSENSDLVSAFSHGVAHSVRNQLTVIMGSAFTMQRIVERSDPELAVTLRETLDRVADVIKSATNQIQAFADFGSPAIDYAPVEVSSLFGDSLRPLVDNAFIKARVELEWGPCAEGIVLRGERTLIGGVLLRTLRALMVGMKEGSVLRVDFHPRVSDVCVSFRGSERATDPTLASRSSADLDRVKTLAGELDAHVEFLSDAGTGIGIDVCLPLAN